MTKHQILLIGFIGIVFAVISFSTAAPSSTHDSSKPCKENDTWKDDCNQCFCGLQSSVYCTKKLCVGNPDEDNPNFETKTDCSKEGVTWKEGCNTCACFKGVEACTLAHCGDQQTEQTEQTAQKTKRATDFTKKCKEGESWMDDCNSCTCIGELPACTEMLCPPDQKPDHQKPIDASKGCDGKETWTAPDGCNQCTCTLGKPACTRMACNHFQVALPEKTKRSVETCKEGETWEQNCNTCTCSGGRPACTLMLCKEDHIDFSKACKEGDSWIAADGCNRCSCNGGIPACTRKLCEKKQKRSTSCNPGSSWREGCPPDTPLKKGCYLKCFCSGPNNKKMCFAYFENH